MRGLACVSAALLLAACGGGGDADDGIDASVDGGHDLGTDLPDAGATDLGDLGPDMPDAAMPDLGVDAGAMCGALRREHVLAAGMLASPTGDDRLFVADRLSGTVRIVDATGALVATPFLDVSASLDTTGYEAGLLAL